MRVLEMAGEFDRWVVVGTSGAGKSTMARSISERWGHQCVDLDALHWLQNWEARGHEEFLELIEETLDEHPRWVVAGNYSVARDVIWPRAEAILWLDFSLQRVMRQLLKRSVARIARRENLWGTGNRESIRRTFFSRDSILLWALKTHGRRRREYPELLERPEWSELAVFQVTDDSVERWR